ncbi:MAG: hypothetical protein P8Y96_14215 [Desulfuromonadales bacterium]
MQKLSLATQTLYAELLEQLTALEAQRSIGQLAGTFTEKTSATLRTIGSRRNDAQ